MTIGVREAAVATGRAAVVAVEKRRRELADVIAARLVPVYNKGWAGAKMALRARRPR